jgi:CO/xanthine dehydrogenase FAD-binding subunit
VLTSYVKFRARQAIDFPVLAVACSLRLVDGVVHDPRVVFGATAPVPLRADEAEAFLEGRVLDATTARAAAQLAVRSCLPLGPNDYKVKVAAELVRRALIDVSTR